jgi:alkanesulfonate monooxygenase SsuD/methylene tetrahydromethanopterin reductase-like flavin-dependent oxidoreductase (luciferase family)
VYLSVFMGPFSLGPAQDLPNIDLCIDQAIAAADAGFAMITFGEQHFNNYEPYCNPFLMAARLAPHLKDSYFGTTICPIVFHHPLRLVEDVNVCDVLTRGKFVLGMSAGRVGFSPDFQNFGLDPADRDELFATKLGTMLDAWAHRPGDAPLVVDTRWDRCELNGRMMPLSYRAGRPLLAVGTNTPTTVARAGEQGMAVFLGPCRLPDAAARISAHREALDAAGHPPEVVADCAEKSFVLHHVIVGETEDEAWERAERMAGMNPMMNRANDPRSLRELAQVDLDAPGAHDDPNWRNAEHVQAWIIAGDPESVTRQLQAHDDAGVHQVHTRFTVGMYNPTDVNASFQLFVDEVMPKLDPRTFAPPTPEQIRPEHQA